MRAFSKQYRYMTNEEGLMSELPSGHKKHFAAGRVLLIAKILQNEQRKEALSCPPPLPL